MQITAFKVVAAMIADYGVDGGILKMGLCYPPLYSPHGVW